MERVLGGRVGWAAVMAILGVYSRQPRMLPVLHFNMANSLVSWLDQADSWTPTVACIAWRVAIASYTNRKLRAWAKIPGTQDSSRVPQNPIEGRTKASFIQVGSRRRSPGMGKEGMLITTKTLENLGTAVAQCQSVSCLTATCTSSRVWTFSHHYRPIPSRISNNTARKDQWTCPTFKAVTTVKTGSYLNLPLRIS